MALCAVTRDFDRYPAGLPGWALKSPISRSQKPGRAARTTIVAKWSSTENWLQDEISVAYWAPLSAGYAKPDYNGASLDGLVRPETLKVVTAIVPPGPTESAETS